MLLQALTVHCASLGPSHRRQDHGHAKSVPLGTTSRCLGKQYATRVLLAATAYRVAVEPHSTPRAGSVRRVLHSRTRDARHATLAVPERTKVWQVVCHASDAPLADSVRWLEPRVAPFVAHV